MRRAVLRVILLAPAFSIGTVVLGWWSLPILGATWGGVSQKVHRPATTAAVAAAAGWGFLLIWNMIAGSVFEVAARVGSVMSLPGPVFLSLGLLFPAAVSGSTAALVSELRTQVRNHRQR